MQMRPRRYQGFLGCICFGVVRGWAYSLGTKFCMDSRETKNRYNLLTGQIECVDGKFGQNCRTNQPKKKFQDAKAMHGSG
ncbi:hypothetical protein C8R43DRAFT_993363 [Mycena crocata]|nr:hypothetical protein C8R43DRAFT_993363 [Mycena crocata]